MGLRVGKGQIYYLIQKKNLNGNYSYEDLSNREPPKKPFAVRTEM